MSSNKKSKNAKLENFSPAELFNQAQQILSSGHFREAIEQFKALLKINDDPEYRAGLAAAYAGRAKELYAKGMIKEAIAIWHNRSQFCPQAPLDIDNIKVLLKHDHTDQALQLINKYKSQLNHQQLHDIQAQLAAIYLSGNNKTVAQLPADDPIIVHGDVIKSAIEAYCNGNDALVNNALASIPFRSPYRDLVQIIKALLKLNDDRNGVINILKKVPTDSAFNSIVHAIELTLMSEFDFYTKLDNVANSTFEFVATLRSWSTTRMQMWQEIKSLGTNPSTSVVEKFMYKYEHLLGKEWIRQKTLRLLVNDIPKVMARSSSSAKNKITELERSIILLWNVTAKKEGFRVLEAWNQVIANARKVYTNLDPGSDDRLLISSLLRNAESKLGLLSLQMDEYNFFEEESADLVTQGQNMLEESITLDPDYLPTYTRLITHYRVDKNLKDARRLLNLALERWPDEPSLLLEGIDISKMSGAFKKATVFAQRLLAQDPINSRAKDGLLESHLAHFRKQIANGSFALANKELSIAEAAVRDERARLKLDVAKQFLLLKEKPVDGLTNLKIYTKLTNTDSDDNSSRNLSKQFAIVLEASYMKFELKELIDSLKLPKITRTNKQDFLLFLRLLQETIDKHRIVQSILIEQFGSAIKYAKDLPLSQEDYENSCNTLEKCRLNGLQHLHAGAALKKWPELPIFEFHYFDSMLANQDSIPSDIEMTRLINAHQRALNDGNNRLAKRIEAIIIKLKFRQINNYEHYKNQKSK